MTKRVKQLALLCLAALSLVFGACAAEAAATPLPAPQNLRMEGKILVWDAVEHAAGYVVRLQNREQEVEGTSFDLSSLAVGTYAVRVKAYGDGGKYANSDWSRFSYTAEEAVARGYDELGYRYTLLEDGTGYSIHEGKANTFKMEKIVIPAYYRGLPVKCIEEGGFQYMKNRVWRFDNGEPHSSPVSGSLSQRSDDRARPAGHTGRNRSICVRGAE